MLPKVVKNLRIDLNLGQVRKSIAINQNSTLAPTLNVYLVDSGSPVSLEDLLYAEIFIHKADNHEAINGCVIDGDSIQYTLHSTDVSAVGINEAQLQLTWKDGSVAITPTFEIVVYQAVVNENVQQSQNEYTSLSQMLVQALDYKNAAEESKDAAAISETNAASSAESAAEDAEAARLSAISAENDANISKDAEAWAKGTRLDVPVESTDQTYHNNAKYYAEAASTEASTAASEATKASTYESQAASCEAKGSEYASENTSLYTATSERASEGAVLLASTSALESQTAAHESETAVLLASTSALESQTAVLNSQTADYLSSTSTYESQAAVHDSNASTYATNASNYATSASEYAATASSQTAAGSMYAASAASCEAATSTYASTGASLETATSEYASTAASEASYASSEAAVAQGYAEQAQQAAQSLTGALKPMGTVTFANLPLLVSAGEGYMYNVSDAFTTTSDFEEGAGVKVAAGSNVYKTANGKWDVLAGNFVSGVKGDNESVYRQGEVNITKENLGLGNVSNPTIKTATLAASATTVTFTGIPTTGNNLIELYTSKAGLEYEEVDDSTSGQLTYTFEAQSAAVTCYLVIREVA